MGDEEAKRIILARRARFVAAALAGLNAAMCGGKNDTVDPKPDASTIAPDGGMPQPCLSPEEPDASADADADAAVDGDADAEPQPCLAPPPSGDL